MSTTPPLLDSMALCRRAPTAAQAQECANNVAAALAMDDTGEMVPALVLGLAVDHRIRMAADHESFAAWRDVDPQVARLHVGKRVAVWLAGRGAR